MADHLSTSEAVRTYDTHPNVLCRLILMGRLSARKDENGHWRISRASLEKWNRQRRRRAKNVDGSPTVECRAGVSPSG